MGFIARTHKKERVLSFPGVDTWCNVMQVAKSGAQYAEDSEPGVS